ncbi:MAG: IscS subfamily cysteine desulfurase [Alphaproteobacteria bacterium]|nr:IscS subfamily cysteine desulfurase [Alphaproteobacteria bacterium]
MSKPKLPIYLDYQSTTPVDPRVVEAMLPFLADKFGNAHSRTHAFGWESEAAADLAREQVATAIGADPKEIVFTSGATESNNLAIKGVLRFHKKKKNHLITCLTEHKCVVESIRDLMREGFDVTFLGVDREGRIDLDALEAAVTEKTALVSIMAVNNEIGVTQPLEKIGALCRERGVLFHTDAAQAVGKVAFDVETAKVDLASLSGHKLYGPKGIGALYVRLKPRVRLEPLFSGGGQEQGLRAGTLPTALCVGFGAAAAIAMAEREEEAGRLLRLRARLLDGLRARLDGVTVNGSLEARVPGNLNVSFAGINSETLMMELRDLALSTGSACSSASHEPSYVLKALGLEDALADASIRIGLGRFTTEAEIDYAIGAFAEKVAKLRAQGAAPAPQPAAMR